jgi:hypothetical protein
MSIGVICMVRRRTARRIGFDENSLRKCIRPLVENDLRAHDDDSHVPVLDNRHGRKRPRYVTGFQARRLTVFSSLLSSADSQEQNFKLHFVKRPGLYAAGDSRSRLPTRPN